jgi:hypothetical protein
MFKMYLFEVSAGTPAIVVFLTHARNKSDSAVVRSQSLPYELFQVCHP